MHALGGMRVRLAGLSVSAMLIGVGGGSGLGIAVIAGRAEADPGGPSRGWSQWAQNAQHTGNVSVSGQTPSQTLAQLRYDPFVPAEQAESGELLGHYQAPLLDGNDVYMEFKTGTYVSCDPPGSGQPFPCGSSAWNQQVWNEKRLHWEGGKLVEKWSFASDWKPEPDGFSYDGVLGPAGWEPVFHAALSNGDVWVPGAGGTVFQLDKGSGKMKQRVNPFASIDAAGTFVSGPHCR